MQKQFNKGDRVEFVCRYGSCRPGDRGTVTATAEDGLVEVTPDGKRPHVCYEHRVRLIEQPQTEVRVRPVYQDGSMSVGVTFPNDAEAKAYVERSGVVGVKYEFIPQVVSTVYEVHEVTTRSAIAVGGTVKAA